ncbi:MAG: hypothetical protein ACK56W_19725 [Pirellula sp.]|jgi:hypothetical protein|nr:hypothetical protein [Pirellula sp.]
MFIRFDHGDGARRESLPSPGFVDNSASVDAIHMKATQLPMTIGEPTGPFSYITLICVLSQQREAGSSIGTWVFCGRRIPEGQDNGESQKSVGNARKKTEE